MKAAIALLAFIAISAAWALPQKEDNQLLDDLKDVFSVLDIESIKKTFYDHLDNDGAIGAVIIYLQSPEWHAMIHEVEDNPKYSAYKEYLENAGLPVTDLVEKIHEFLESLTPANVDSTASLRPFLDDVGPYLDVAEVKEAIGAKVDESAVFSEFYQSLSTSDFKQIFSEVDQLAEVQRIKEKLDEMDFNLEAYNAVINCLLGWDESYCP